MHWNLKIKKLSTCIEKDQLIGIENLVLNMGILFCALCSMSQEALAEYINFMSVESSLQWLLETK
jgi:hypothetical protein